MDLIAGIVAGGVVGWIAFSVLNVSSERGLRASLAIGILGGVLGVQLASMMVAGDANAATNAGVNVFSLVLAAASAAGCIIIVNMIARRRGG